MWSRISGGVSSAYHAIVHRERRAQKEEELEDEYKMAQKLHRACSEGNYKQVVSLVKRDRAIRGKIPYREQYVTHLSGLVQVRDVVALIVDYVGERKEIFNVAVDYSHVIRGEKMFQMFRMESQAIHFIHIICSFGDPYDERGELRPYTPTMKKIVRYLLSQGAEISPYLRGRATDYILGRGTNSYILGASADFTGGWIARTISLQLNELEMIKEEIVPHLKKENPDFVDKDLEGWFDFDGEEGS